MGRYVARRNSVCVSPNVKLSFMTYTKLCSSKGLCGQITTFGFFFGLTIKKIKDVVFSMYFKHSTSYINKNIYG